MWLDVELIGRWLRWVVKSVVVMLLRFLFTGLLWEEALQTVCSLYECKQNSSQEPQNSFWGVHRFVQGNISVTFLSYSCISGNYGNSLDTNSPPASSVTQPTVPVSSASGDNYSMPWANKKPCCSVDCFWEDCEFRMRASNLLLKASTKIVSDSVWLWVIDDSLLLVSDSIWLWVIDD